MDSVNRRKVVSITYLKRKSWCGGVSARFDARLLKNRALLFEVRDTPDMFEWTSVSVNERLASTDTGWSVLHFRRGKRVWWSVLRVWILDL